MLIRTGQNYFPSRNYKTIFKAKVRMEIDSKITFNMIYGKPCFLCSLAVTFWVKTALPLGPRNGNLEQFLSNCLTRNWQNF